MLASHILVAVFIGAVLVSTGGTGTSSIIGGGRIGNFLLALSVLGFNGPIEVLNRGWALERLIAHLYETYGPRRTTDGGPSICILMDWDRTGGRLQKSLTERLESMDVKVCDALRNQLSKALKPETRVVESLKSLAVDLMPFIEMEDSIER